MDKAFPTRKGKYKVAERIVIVKSIYGLMIILFFGFLSLPSHAQQSTLTDGAWSNDVSWTGGSLPSSADDAVINHNLIIDAGTTAEINNLVIGPAGKLTVEGRLIVYGNLTMENNDPEFITGAESSIFIYGNAVIANKVNINLTSYFITLGDFTITGGGGTDIYIDDASIYVFGDFDGGATRLVDCDNYDNLTSNETDSCHIGTEAAFEANIDEGLIPPDVLELVNACSSIEVFIAESSETCNAASGVFNSSDEVTSKIYFYVNMIAEDDRFNSAWEFSFTISSPTGAILKNVSDGSNLLVQESGIYMLSGITSHSGAGSVTLSMDVTGNKYIEQSVVVEIVSARELNCNISAVAGSRWQAVQIINAIPETSSIRTD